MKKCIIYRVQSGDGDRLDSQKEILSAGVEFFQNLFRGENTIADFQLGGDHIPRIIEENVNEKLVAVPPIKGNL